MRKGFTGIFKDSISIFRNSVWSVLGIYLGFVIVGILLGVIAALAVGRDVMVMLSMFSTDPSVINSMLPQLGMLFVFFLLFIFLAYIVGFWTIIVFKNNALLGKSFIKEAFFESCRKIWKVILWGLILAICFGLITLISALLLQRWAFIFLFPFMVFIMPLAYTVSFGIMCQEGGFGKILTQNFALGYKNWGYIFISVLLYMIALFASIIIVGGVQFLIVKVIGLALLGSIIGAIFNFLLNTFTSCFFTVFYLNLSGMALQGETLEQVQQEQVIQNN